MATSSGKKGKKTSKKNKLSLGEFLTDGNASAVQQVQVAVPVKLRNWADECDDDEDDRPTRTQMIALPTAPRATRLLNDDTVPHHGPFQAYISNLPYDLTDPDLYDFFMDMEIVQLRLPRDDGDSGRLRGFGYVEFAKRQDLIDALSITEPIIHGRRIRIDLSSESDNKRQQRNRYDNNYGGDPDRPMGNWRDAPRSNVDRGDQSQRRPYNSNYNRDRGDRGDRDQDRERFPSDGGNWRLGDRPAPQSPPASRRGYERDRGDREDRGFRRGGDFSGDRGGRRDADPPMERPKLVLQPRTLPLPAKPKPESEPEDSEERDASRERKYDSEASENKENEDHAEPRPKPTPVPAANIFGDAKPVDTAARLKELEERLAEKNRLAREERKKAAAAAAAAASDASSVAAGSSADEDGREKTDPSKDETAEEHSEEPKRQPEPKEPVNWRVRSSEDKDGERRGQSPQRRYSPTRKFNKRPDDYSDNRDLRDNRDRQMNRDNRTMRDNRRDYNRPGDRDRGDRGFRGDRDREITRGGGPARDMPRDDRDNRDRRDHDRPPVENRDREQKPIEERMPKLQESTGPNLQMKNTFEGLSADEVDD